MQDSFYPDVRSLLYLDNSDVCCASYFSLVRLYSFCSLHCTSNVTSIVHVFNVSSLYQCISFITFFYNFTLLATSIQLCVFTCFCFLLSTQIKNVSSRRKHYPVNTSSLNTVSLKTLDVTIVQQCRGRQQYM